MRLRWSVPGASVAGLYAAGACLLASREAIGNGCMGWCFGAATFPEFLALIVLPTSFFYSPAWQQFFVFVFGIGTIAFNSFVLYVTFGGVAWWRGRDRQESPGNT